MGRRQERAADTRKSDGPRTRTTRSVGRSVGRSDEEVENCLGNGMSLNRVVARSVARNSASAINDRSQSQFAPCHVDCGGARRRWPSLPSSLPPSWPSTSVSPSFFLPSCLPARPPGPCSVVPPWPSACLVPSSLFLSLSSLKSQEVRKKERRQRNATQVRSRQRG